MVHGPCLPIFLSGRSSKTPTQTTLGVHRIGVGVFGKFPGAMPRPSEGTRGKGGSPAKWGSLEEADFRAGREGGAFEGAEEPRARLFEKPV